MGRKKKRSPPNPRDRIFCYYCDRTFQNEQELLMHQRQKHLRCPTCNKRMLSIPSLTIHSEQMHNITVTTVPNAISTRASVLIDVLGMKGIPDHYYASLEQPVTPWKIPRSNPSSVAPEYSNSYVQQYSHPVSYHSYPAQLAYNYHQHPIQAPYSSYPPPSHSVLPTSTPVPSSTPVSSSTPVPSSTPAPTPTSAPPSTPVPSVTPGPKSTPVPVSHTTPVVSHASPNPPVANVRLVFDAQDLSMEELRALLPRYRRKPIA